MLIQYAYIKPRSQFGKQCFFDETDPIVEENILPDPEIIRDYVHRSHCHRSVQKSEQFALHEMQTASKVTKETGMLHSEGGWPKEINVKDEEAVQRFRRRVEKDEQWAPRMKKLTDPIERCVRQNNVINIYENYFDDIVPTAMVLSRGVRTSNVYVDPQPVVRPVSHLSWSPREQNRLAASYSFTEFEKQPPNVDPSSYIWDIENPNVPLMCLKSSSPLMTIEFNPRDPSMLISGLMSGQVCNWDIRIGNRPVQMSHRQFSHRNPANQALWTTSKTNTEFFSASNSGTIKWWDIRRLRQPTEELVMDLDDPLRASTIMTIGVTTLQFEPTMGSRFMAGMENGVIVNANRRAVSPIDKLATRINSHIGPVVAIDRNPFVPKYFLTVGDCTAKIWADDTKESSLITIREQDADLSGGCWSKSRYSVFFTINVTGVLQVYDVLVGINEPVTTLCVCHERLTAIAPHGNGQLLAIGSREGTIYLVECSEGYAVNTKTDKANFTAYLERCSRFEKAVDSRMKEIRLQASVRQDTVADRAATVSKTKPKKGDNKERSKVQVREKGDEKPKKRFRPRKTENAFFAEDPELAETEAEYFRAVERALASYPSLEYFDVERITSLMQEISRKKKKREQLKTEEEVVEKPTVARARTKATKTRSRVELFTRKMEVAKEKEEIVTMETPFLEPKEAKEAKEKRRRKKILSKVCAVEICKPEICCADMEEKRKARLQAQLALKGKEFSRTPRPCKSSDLARKLPERSAVWRRRILLPEDGSLDILADKVKEARREVRAWQKRIASGKRDFWRFCPHRTTEIVREKSGGGKKEEAGNSDNESPVRDDVVEGRWDFRQLAETSPVRESGSEGEEDEASREERGERKEDYLQLEKYARGTETRPTLSACTSVHSGDVTDATTRTAMTTTTEMSPTTITTLST